MGRRSDPGDGRTRLHVTLLSLLMISSLIRVAGLETLNERWFEPARLIVCRKATTFFFFQCVFGLVAGAHRRKCRGWFFGVAGMVGV